MTTRFCFALTVLLAMTSQAFAQQQVPAPYADVLTLLNRQGDFADGVLKVNIPRSDIKVVVQGVATPTPFGFGGWIAFSRGDAGMDVMMGDLVLTEAEVNPIMSAVLEGGLDVTALHNHFFFDQPRMFYMHVHGHGMPMDLARRIKPALDAIGKTPAPPGAAGQALEGKLDVERLASIIGHKGDQTGPVYKITIGRPDINLREMGAPVNARMGLNTWAAFYGSDADAVVAGDVAMLDTEVTRVLKALRASNLAVVAIHHHMVGTRPTVFFLHYWGRGPAEKLAAGVRAALDTQHTTEARR
jgi:hypothetical protein